MGEKLTGGCQCGAVRFRVDGEPEAVNLCHCRMCQKASGQPFMAFARFPNADIVWKGALSTFRSSEAVERGFCAACGTPLTYRNLSSDRTSLAICAFDDPSGIVPTEQLAAESAVPWLAAALAAKNTPLAAWFAARPAPGLASRQHPDHD